MSKRNTPLDAILPLLPSLSEKDKDRLKRELGMLELSACEKTGHAFKAVKSYSTGFLGSGAPVTIMACSKCGKRETV